MNVATRAERRGRHGVFVVCTIAVSAALVLVLTSRRAPSVVHVLGRVTASAGNGADAGAGALYGAASSPLDPLRELELERCGRLFIDAGSNTGEAVSAFLRGGFYGCAMAAPYRVYPQRWAGMSRAARHAVRAEGFEPPAFRSGAGAQHHLS